MMLRRLLIITTTCVLGGSVTVNATASEVRPHTTRNARHGLHMNVEGRDIHRYAGAPMDDERPAETVNLLLSRLPRPSTYRAEEGRAEGPESAVKLILKSRFRRPSSASLPQLVEEGRGSSVTAADERSGGPERRRIETGLRSSSASYDTHARADKTMSKVGHKGRWRGPCQGWQMGERLTPAIWAQDPAKGHRQMVRLVTCLFNRYAPGNTSTALYVMDRESSGYPFAWNVASDCRGLYQHRGPYWLGRVHAFLSRWMFGPGVWPPTAFDPRANVIVAARMVAQSGWGPWTTAP